MRIVWSDFNAYTDNNLDTVPEQAGVYLLWMKLTQSEWRVLYAGEAGVLRATLKQHRTVKETNLNLRRKIVCCVTGFEYSVQPDEEVRKGIVKYLNQFCKPECLHPNLPPEAEPIEVNLP